MTKRFAINPDAYIVAGFKNRYRTTNYERSLSSSYDELTVEDWSSHYKVSVGQGVMFYAH